ncbi:charged multivesicular body protein 3 [Paragonimus westermani]|uniref:Charged multivesicular body protein 3 n=1 Tax=Paragonimus westermani TaxID=34504 RepID=A0A5J4NGI7_9TREM|nr:charged multivesicular body protein 3 [Paragonimus westermani]
MGIFGEKSNPREKLRNMVSIIRRQKYKVQRDIGTLQLQTTKITADIKKYAKAGQLDEAKIVARELVNSRKAISRLRAASAHMDCLVSEINCQAATAKLAGSLKSSTAVMKSISALIKLPDLHKTMQEMSKEMMKMGIIEEMVEDTMESVMGDSDVMEEATAAEVDKVMREITGELPKTPEILLDSVPTGVPVAGGSRASAQLVNSIDEAEPDEGDLAEMQARLAALRN